MLDYIKNICVSDLKRDYSSNHGFVFLSSNKSSDRSIEELALALKKSGITKENPVLVTRLNEGIAFVYDEFDGPRFWNTASQVQQIMGLKTVPLCFFLRESNG